jgi:hypothetical protein
MEQALIQSQQELKPIILKNILLLSPGKWNEVDYTELEIQKAFNNTDWNNRKFRTLYLDHQDTKERGVANFAGFIQNPRMVNSNLYGDLEVWNPMIGAYLAQAKAKFGISATLAGRENKKLSRMEDFHFESFSIVTDPACKPALINLQDKQVNMVENKDDVQIVTMENEVAENLVELESEKHRIRREDSESMPDKKDFNSVLKAQMIDEKRAPADYENLKSLTDDENMKKKIDGIISDERRHYEVLESFMQKETLEMKELDAIFERQVQHIKDSLRKSHPDWSEKKITSVAYATANKLKGEKEKENADKMEKELSDEEKEIEELAKVTAFEEVRKSKGMSPSEFYAVPREPPSSSSLPIFDAAHVRNAIARFNQTHLSPSEKAHAWSAIVRAAKRFDIEVSSQKENSDTQQVKGGVKEMPEKMENESKVAELETKSEKIEEMAKEPKKEEPKKEEPKKEEPKEEKKSEPEKPKADKEEEELSNDAILNKVKEMSAEELVSYTSFVKAYLSEHASASAKEVTLAYEKSKAGKKELSAADLLASIDSRIAALKELDSTKKMQSMEQEIKELSAKVKTPDRKTLSVAFSGAKNQDSNLGMLSFLQHRIS